MPRAVWPLRAGLPVIEVVLSVAQSSQALGRTLLADTGAGSLHSGFELILEENDCLLCGGIPAPSVVLGGAFVGSFPVYVIRVQIPAIGFDHQVPVVGVPSVPAGMDGIACFRFLSRFTYGNFGRPDEFGLET